MLIVWYVFSCMPNKQNTDKYLGQKAKL